MRRRLLEVGHVPGVEQVETAVGHHQPFAVPAELITPGGQLLERQDFFARALIVSQAYVVGSEANRRAVLACLGAAVEQTGLVVDADGLITTARAAAADVVAAFFQLGNDLRR